MRADYSPNFIDDYVDVPGTPVTVSPVFDSSYVPANFYTGTTPIITTPYIPKYNSDWGFTNPYSTAQFT